MSSFDRAPDACKPFAGLVRGISGVFAGIAVMFALGCGEKEAPNTAPPLVLRQQRMIRPAAARPMTAAIPDRLQDSKLPVYEIVMDPGVLMALERNPFSNEKHPAKFMAGGEVFDKAQIRFRGAWARTWPKRPLKIFFPKEKPFQKHHCLNLNSGWRDPAFVREALAYHVFAACGVPSPEARMVRVQMNGEFRGLYVEIEQPEKEFLARYDLKGASIFKAVSRSNQADERDLGSERAFMPHYERHTHKTEGMGDLQKFCHDLAMSRDPAGFFAGHVDVEKYVNYLAASVLVQHWDGFNKNHYLVYEGRGTGKWFAVPWDLDRTFGDHWAGSFSETELPVLLGTERMPGVTGWNRLQDHFFRDPGLRLRFSRRLQELLEKEFTAEKLFPMLDKLESDIQMEAALDRQRWGGAGENLHEGITQVKEFIERRRAFLLAQLNSLAK